MQTAWRTYLKRGMVVSLWLLTFFVFTPSAHAVSTGVKTAGADAAVTTNAGDNNGFQTTPGNTTSNDNNFAVDTNTGTGTTTDGCGTFPQSEDDQHDFYNFNFNIPTAATSTINGITLESSSLWDSATGVNELCFALSWDGGTSWTTATGTGDVGVTETANTRGGSTNTWGRTWSANEFSNTNFRVRVMSDVSANNARDVSLDYLALSVDYDYFSPAITLSGTLYSDEGSTQITTGKTIKAAVSTSTVSVFSTSTNSGAGTWSITIPAGHTVATGTPIVVWVDNDTVNATTFTKASSLNNISGIDLYQDRVIVSHEGTSANLARATEMAFYDGDDDSDIQYISNNGLTGSDGLGKRAGGT
jgi:hypothetical protein